MIGVLPGPTGAGNIDALAKDEIDSANAAVKAKVLNTLRPPELNFLEGVMINENHWTPNRMNDIAMRQLSSIHAHIADSLLPAAKDLAVN